LNQALAIDPIAGLVVTDPDTINDLFMDSVAEHARVISLHATHGSLPQELVLSYSGRIHHEFSHQTDYARGFSTTAGLVDTTGVFLAGETYWLPTFPDSLITFTMSVSLPPGWDVISQGDRLASSDHADDPALRPESRATSRAWRHHPPVRDDRIVVWRCTFPMEEAYLVAGRYHRFEQPCGTTSAQTYLFDPDTLLAVRYLDATCRYLSMYGEMIGPYPYEKFALVENFWQTGYGMPSFTLLGNRVIRLPFIVHTSYGHEILHNWWGNGVYVDYETGNWCEGLTSYLADHHYKEYPGEQSQHRLKLLDHYAWYAVGDEDFPLTEFRERTSSATEAVGYGKSAMVFHMLRKKLGDEEFFRAVERLWQERMFKRTSWSDIATVFTEASGIDLNGFFAQWVEKQGAPHVQIENASSKGTDVHLILAQAKPPYQLDVPVRLVYEQDDTLAQMHYTLPMAEARLDTKLSLPGRPVRLEIDQEFDLFRLLNRDESPPALGLVFGADTTAFVTAASESLVRDSWPGETTLVPTLSEHATDQWGLLVVGSPTESKSILLDQFSGKIQWQDSLLVVNGEMLGPNTTLVAASTGPNTSGLCWIRPATGLTEQELKSIIGKLTHYHNYSYLVFDGMRCTARGSWEHECRSMVVRFAAGGESG
jgi:hypothetical protein